MAAQQVEEPKPQWQQIGEAFVTQYYQIFDGPTRGGVVGLYHPSAWMQYENHKGTGHEAIMKIITEEVKFRTIQHVVTKCDCQPTMDDGIIIVVTGRLKTDDDPPHAFNQTFFLRQDSGNFFLFHDIFRLSIHDSA